MSETVQRDIQKRCRFVFEHRGGVIGLTHDGKLADEARRAGLSIQQYERAPGGRVEWEIYFKPEVIKDPDSDDAQNEYQRTE